MAIETSPPGPGTAQGNRVSGWAPQCAPAADRMLLHLPGGTSVLRDHHPSVPRQQESPHGIRGGERTQGRFVSVISTCVGRRISFTVNSPAAKPETAGAVRFINMRSLLYFETLPLQMVLECYKYMCNVYVMIDFIVTTHIGNIVNVMI